MTMRRAGRQHRNDVKWARAWPAVQDTSETLLSVGVGGEMDTTRSGDKRRGRMAASGKIRKEGPIESLEQTSCLTSMLSSKKGGGDVTLRKGIRKSMEAGVEKTRCKRIRLTIPI